MFNLGNPKTIRVFDKDIPVDTWNKYKLPEFLNFSIEKGETYKEAIQRAFVNHLPESREQIKNMPGFDPIIFQEITGITKDIK